MKKSLLEPLPERSNTVVSALEDHLGFWLRFVSNHVSGRFVMLLDQHGISGTEWVVLRALYDHPVSSHSALIDVLGMTKGAASKVVTRLEAKSLVQRSPRDERSREQSVSLTPAGRTLVPKLAALADDNDTYFFSHLPQHVRRDLVEQMKSLVRQHGLKQVPVE